MALEVKHITDLEWTELIKTNNHVIEHDDDHYIIREFQRTECDWKYFYLKNGSYAEKIAMIDGKVEFNVGDISTHTFDDFVQFRVRDIIFSKQGKDYYFYNIAKPLIGTWIKLNWKDEELVDKYIFKVEKTIMGWDIPEHVKTLIINKLYQKEA